MYLEGLKTPVKNWSHMAAKRAKPSLWWLLSKEFSNVLKDIIAPIVAKTTASICSFIKKKNNLISI